MYEELKMGAGWSNSCLVAGVARPLIRTPVMGGLENRLAWIKIER